VPAGLRRTRPLEGGLGEESERRALYFRRYSDGPATELEGGTVALPPPLSEDQRRQALAKAAEARRQRAALKDQLRSGEATLKDLLDRTDDEIVGKLKVSDVLQTMRGVGKVRARKIMTRLDIAESRRMRGLGAKQIESLLREFTGK
jgi:hypothetical protein